MCAVVIGRDFTPTVLLPDGRLGANFQTATPLTNAPTISPTNNGRMDRPDMEYPVLNVKVPAPVVRCQARIHHIAAPARKAI
jgi:hypothetical protein